MSGRHEATLRGLVLTLAIGHSDAWTFAKGQNGEALPKAQVLAEGANYLAGAEAEEPLKRALLLEFSDPVEYEGLEWRFAIATIRYIEEPFERIAIGRPVTAHVHYISPNAVKSPDPFSGTWSESSPFLVAKLEPVP
jgi:hypothetical protein